MSCDLIAFSSFLTQATFVFLQMLFNENHSLYVYPYDNAAVYAVDSEGHSKEVISFFDAQCIMNSAVACP